MLLLEETSLSQAYAMIARLGDQDPQAQAYIAAIRRDLGERFHNLLIAAYVYSKIEPFEKRMGLPARSAKALLPLMASVLEAYHKETLRHG